MPSPCSSTNFILLRNGAANWFSPACRSAVCSKRAFRSPPRPARQVGLVLLQLRLRHGRQQSGPQLVVADVGIEQHGAEPAVALNDLAEEAFRNREAPEVLEAVQQPVGVGRIAARLELPEPDEPRHAGVDRLFEQMLEVAPQPGRRPLGDAGFDPAFRVDERGGAETLNRRRGRQDGPRAPAGLDEPPDHVLVRLRLRRFFAEPLDKLTRRAAREGPEPVQAAQLRPDARAGSRTAPRSRRARPRPGGAGGR